MKVRELIRELQTLNQEAEIVIYDNEGEPVAPNTINVSQNDDDCASEYALFNEE